MNPHRCIYAYCVLNQMSECEVCQVNGKGHVHYK